MLPSTQKHLYNYTIDEHGNWFCEGNPVIDPDVFRLLSRSLFEQDGHFFIRCEGEVHPLHVADAPLWIRYVHLGKDSEGKLVRIEIELQDGRMEALDPETLTVARNEALYCLATRRRLRARFGKAAYYEIANTIEMDRKEGPFFIVLDRKRFVIEPESEA